MLEFTLLTSIPRKKTTAWRFHHNRVIAQFLNTGFRFNLDFLRGNHAGCVEKPLFAEQISRLLIELRRLWEK